jgi:type IV pilus assembly protein PilM
MPIHRFASLRQVEVANSARAVASSSEAVLAAMIGVAARSSQPNRAPELLPRVIREELVFRRRQPIFITAAMLVVLALIPPLHHFQTLAKAGHAEASNKEAQLHPLRQVHAHHAQLLQQIEQARKSIEETRYAADKKTSWLRFLTELQDRLVSVEDVWLESLSLVRVPAAAPIPIQAAVPAADLRLIVTGRLLDERNPISKVSPEAYQRVKALISSFNGSQFIAAIEQERFDSSQSGILRFDLTLVVRPDNPL